MSLILPKCLYGVTAEKYVYDLGDLSCLVGGTVDIEDQDVA